MSFGIKRKLGHFLNFTNGADSIAAGTTAYMSVGGSITDSATEAARSIIIPQAAVLTVLTAVTGNSQPGSGSLVLTVRKNGVDTAVVLTIAAGAAAGTYSTTTTAVAFAENDLLSLKAVNNASGTSAAITTWSIKTL